MTDNLRDSIDLIAHRGCSACAPENTISAFTAGAAHLDWIELDVRQCQSGELVVHHDETVDERTDASGPIADYTWDELCELNLDGTSAHIPRLTDVFTAVPDHTGLQIEIKDPAATSRIADLAEQTPHPTRITSFSTQACRTLRERDTPVGFLFKDNPHENVRRADEWNCTTVHPRADMCLSTDVVDIADDYGLDVIAWDGLTPSQVEKLVRAGVTGVTIDRACEWPGIRPTNPT